MSLQKQKIYLVLLLFINNNVLSSYLSPSHYYVLVLFHDDVDALHHGVHSPARKVSRAAGLEGSNKHEDDVA